ncbi:MAG TPA: peptidylprolyl isomerase, partial [Victivallales bacterium]|nr:peptidylprolyl isomerase [Victivallales bacterium]
LGEYTINELPKPFIDAIEKVPEGEISAPFKSLRGWHIVRVDKRTKAEYINTKEAFPVIKKILIEKKLNAKLKELIEKEKKDRKCIIFL